MCEDIDMKQGDNLKPLMKKPNSKSANKAAYVDHWFLKFGEPYNDGVTADQLPNGMWVCKLKLPLIDKTVKATSKSAANAMANASEKATKLIIEYLEEHPDIKFHPVRHFRHYEFYTSESGYTGFQLSSEYRKKVGDDMLKMQLESTKAIEKAVAKIAKINGTDKNLFVQVIDKSYFDKDDTTEDIQRKIRRKMLGDTSDWYIAWQVTSVHGNCVIAAGYIMED